MQRAIAVFGLFLVCVMSSQTAFGQAVQKQYIADFGGAFTQATVTKAYRGFAGIDIQGCKMLTSNLSLGVSTGYDVVSFRKAEGIYERLAIIPILAKARCYFTVAPMMQIYASAAGGFYQSVPHLSIEPIGGIWNSGAKAGGALGVGFSYWFLGSQGIGAEFEYNFFDSGAKDLFSYFAFRVNYSLIKM